MSQYRCVVYLSPPPAHEPGCQVDGNRTRTIYFTDSFPLTPNYPPHGFRCRENGDKTGNRARIILVSFSFRDNDFAVSSPRCDVLVDYSCSPCAAGRHVLFSKIISRPAFVVKARIGDKNVPFFFFFVIITRVRDFLYTVIIYCKIQQGAKYTHFWL